MTTIRVELNKVQSKEFEEVKKHLGLQNNTDVVRSLIKEKSRKITVKAQLASGSNINERIDYLFFQGYFDEFLEELAEKEPEMFAQYVKQQSKPREKKVLDQ